MRGWEDEPIKLHSEIYTVGLNMISLVLGEHREFLHPEKMKGHDFGNEEKYWLPADFDKPYTHFLMKTVLGCLKARPGERPRLTQLLYDTRKGLEQWEKVYGSADRIDIFEFMKFDVFKEEEFPIGAEAPKTWDWPRKWKAEEPEQVSSKQMHPALTDARASPPPPKKARSVSRKSSKTLIVSSPGKGDIANQFQEKDEGTFVSGSNEKVGGVETRSLKYREAKHRQTEGAEKSVEGGTSKKKQAKKDLESE